MITVHHLNNSRSQRILWLLEELELPYEIVRYERDAETMLAPQSLKDVHPLGKSPVITDGETTIAESGTIVEYLLEKYGLGRLMPGKDSADYWQARFWLHYAEGSAMPPLLMKLVFNRVKEADMPFFVKPVAKGIADKVLSNFVNPQVKNHMAYWEDSLAATGWFAGTELSAADIMMSFPVEAVAARTGLGSDHPNLKAWLEKVHGRDTYKAALEKGGEYALMS
ncbi:glutathione S-transferase [Parvularcula flava]|uniref:glutathione transferase n=1 Tax=Aquisalinus luteolus TaxID=1566827 RepID=A0A8J3EQU5_9PROT|nr:glutathione S-transferase [Aquisalinus luteolus]NHK27875.1 glutathione S-transferase [Aquisalinus luteolus]GGH96768.1 glutathione S-transferase [Aquisalinus luteolus]